MKHSFRNKAGLVACLVVCAACAQVALMSVTPAINALASQLDPSTGREVVDLEKKQDWPGMLKLAQTLLQREPGRADWWFLQGYALGRLGRRAEAVQSYEQAIRISPEDEGSWMALGEVQGQLGQHERAIQTYKQALRYRPESAQAYLALADTYLRQRQPDLAIANYRECLRYAADTAPCWYGLAVAYQSAGQGELRDEALKGLRQLDAAAADQLEKQFRPK